MSRKIIVDGNFPNETRVVLLDSNNNIEEIEYETANKQQNKGNIYLAKIMRIEPSLQAVFIEYGNDKRGFLPFIEIDPNYYNIGTARRDQLQHLQEIIPSPIINDEIEENIEIDISEYKTIDETQLLDEKSLLEFDLEALETDIEPISPIKEVPPTSAKEEKIQHLLKNGQLLLVQLTKEERGNKCAAFTTFISLAGKYCVLMPNKPSQNGISRKISHVNERKRLKNIITNLAQYSDKSPSSVIARTAAMGHTLSDLKKDYGYLVRLWNKILASALKANAPSFIHQEDGIIQKIIRDMFNRHVSELLIQGTAGYQKAIKFINEISPAKINKINEYKNKIPIFTNFNIEEQLIKLYQPIITLSSGGYIVINPTEALISIDVNSGRSTSEKTIEETALKTNLEAAKEIAKQIKLRDLSGLLVIDFIDMQEVRNKKIIERAFKEFLSRDRAKIQVGSISIFGLLEMSRQRMRQSFLEANSSICSHCNGKGVVRADESNSMLILRTIENEIFDNTNEIDTINVYANTNAVIYLLNNKREEISYIEQKYIIKLNFFCDPLSTSDSYSLEKIKSTNQLQQMLPLVNSDIETSPTITQTKVKNKQHNRQTWKTSTKPKPIMVGAEKTEASLVTEGDIKEPAIDKAVPIMTVISNAQDDAVSMPSNVQPSATANSKRRHIRKKMYRRKNHIKVQNAVKSG